MDAALGPVAYVASGEGPELVAERPLDDEDQLVADVAMASKLGIRLTLLLDFRVLGSKVVRES